MHRPYRNYSDEDINLLVRDIESAIADGQGTPDDYKQLALLDAELAEREWG